MTPVKIVFLGLGIFTTSLGMSSGFEQALMWSGKNVGMGSAVTSYVEGPESLFFNPAGMVSGAEDAINKNEMSFNLSYLRSQFKAPVVGNNQNETSKYGDNFTGSALYTRQITKDFAYGIGVFPSGGLAVKYNKYDLGMGVSGTPNINLKIVELSSGIAYKPISDLSIGLAYRITYSAADFTVLAPNPAVVEFKDLKGMDFLSFRGGVQYKKDNWGTGMSFRTPIIVKVSGDAELRSPLPTATDGDASISTTFPLMLTFGGYVKPTRDLTLLLDYDFLNYKQTDDLAIKSKLGLSNQSLKWKDGHIIRFGAEYSFKKALVRLGYVFGTAVTNPDTMTPTTEAPGPGHNFTVGGGYEFTENFTADLAAFYGIGKKETSSTTALSGKYQVSGYGFHSGVGLKF